MRPSFAARVVASMMLALSAPAASEPFYSQLHLCPDLCQNVGPSPSNWTRSNDLARLSQCNQTILLDFAIFNPLDDPNTHTSIRACTTDADAAPSAKQQGVSTCVGTIEVSTIIQFASWGFATTAKTPSVVSAVESLRYQLSSEGNCDSSTGAFAYFNGTAIGLYAGRKIDSKGTVDHLLQQHIDRARNQGVVDSFASQVCGSGRDGEHTVGLIVNTNADFAFVQQAMQRWSNATCLDGYDTATVGDISVSERPPTKPTALVGGRWSLGERATCTYIQVVSGDSCGSLASKCGISPAQFATFNPSPRLCSTLQIGQYVCCSAGDLPDFTPVPNPDGSCATYSIKAGDYCSLIAASNSVTVASIELYNRNTWGWQGCGNIQQDQLICLSSGAPPMPAPVSNAICGPQVPGTQRPSDWSQIAGLNPCPLNACCNIWGQCGITDEFCTVSGSPTGAPGTSAPGTAGCISNCGTSIANNANKPDRFIRVGYFESWSAGRAGLKMDAAQIPSGFSHIHFAFAEITPDFDVDVSAVSAQWNKFVGMRSFKRIVSFGGWSFSTDLDSFPIFRESVTPAQRQTFANNVVAFINRYNLDGVDFDWEYPGAPDIPGIPSGSPQDGVNYLDFLRLIRSLLPPNKTVSIAAPASYWYLKGFPIAEMAPVLDYIVYMTYDLHGQWDHGNTFSNPACPNGNCLRSHVNLTETNYALAMITKAGVPASKVVVGVSSYGRSFGMTDPSCTGPLCRFDGPDSTALAGPHTQTAGYLANAEISNLIQLGAQTYFDGESQSDIAVYQGTWVAYMNQETKNSRSNLYAANNFGGIVDWAVDLDREITGYTIDEEEAVRHFNLALLESQFPFDGNVTDLATRLVRYDGCSYRERTLIYSGWQQSWKIMNVVYELARNGINFNEAAALEYLGPPGLISTLQERFNAIFRNIATIQAASIPTRFDWRIHVRCDDPDWKCTCTNTASTIAYTVNLDPYSGIARINFCPEYFRLKNLDQVIAEHADRNNPASVWADLTNYVANKGHTWFHELLHIDWVSLAVDYGPNNRVSDVELQIRNDATQRWYEAYGTRFSKTLARLDGGGFNIWTIRNADSMTMYAMAQYVQKQLGNVYPHLPLAALVPSRAREPVILGPFRLDENGDATILDQAAMDAVAVAPNGVCAADDDGGAGDAVVHFTAVATKGAYPTEYLSSLSSWHGLLPPTPTPTPTQDPYQFCTGVDIGSLSCEIDCCGFIPCPAWCNDICGGVDPDCM